MSTANKEIRILALQNDIPMWQIANYIGVSESTLYRKMKHELDPITAGIVCSAIEKIRKEGFFEKTNESDAESIMAFNVKVGKQIAMLRLSKDETQYDMALKLRISRTTLSQIETGFTGASAKVIADIADIYDVSADWLLGRKTPLDELNEIDDDVANSLRFSLYKQLPDIFDIEWANKGKKEKENA